MLMKRREALDARMQKRVERVLGEVDFLLGVNDETRMGALQFRVLGQKSTSVAFDSQSSP